MTAIIISTFIISIVLLFLSYHYINKWIQVAWRIGALLFFIEIFIAVWFR